jgi:hypothetical protein
VEPLGIFNKKDVVRVVALKEISAVQVGIKSALYA